MKLTLYDFFASLFNEYTNDTPLPTENVSEENDDEYNIITIESSKPTPYDCVYAFAIHFPYYSQLYSTQILRRMHKCLRTMPPLPLHVDIG